MSSPALQRLLVPRHIALIGGAWTDAVAAAARTIGYGGEIWRIHPTRASTPTTPYFRSVEELPAGPDAAFIAVPNREVPAVAAALAARDAGGFVCFSAGFAETATDEGRQLARELEQSATALPFLGPNCYGFVNFFDRVALWPDQLVGAPLTRGVALICQSGTIALTLMFNRRSLPIGYLLTVGNQARLSVEGLIETLADDARVSAFGIYIEGVQDTAALARAAEKARANGKPIALIKSGRTAAAARTAHSHTGALAGADDVFDAFCRQAGIARCDTLATLCETLKIFHMGGALHGRRVFIMGASGGDMAMTADVSRQLGLDFAQIPPDARTRLGEILSGRVTLANPFDFHTYIWFDRPALRALFSVVLRAGFDAAALMVDCPPEHEADGSSYLAVIEEFLHAAQGAPTRAAVIASLPETLSSATRAQCFAAGVVPLQGQREALEALDQAGAVGDAWGNPAALQLTLPARRDAHTRTLPEHLAKAALAAYGVKIPRSQVVGVEGIAAAAAGIGFPVVLKAVSADLMHLSEMGGVILNVRTPEQAERAGQRLAALSSQILVEEMIGEPVAEILIGVTRDAQFGQVLVLGAGGTLTELLRDKVCLLPPFTAQAIAAGLARLSVARLLSGYRGKPAGDRYALIDTVLAVTRYAQAHLESLLELDVNPVIVREVGAVAVDAMIRLLEEP